MRLAEKATQCVMSNREFALLCYDAFEDMKSAVETNQDYDPYGMTSTFIKLLYLHKMTGFEYEIKNIDKIESIIDSCFDKFNECK